MRLRTHFATLLPTVAVSAWIVLMGRATLMTIESAVSDLAKLAESGRPVAESSVFLVTLFATTVFVPLAVSRVRRAFGVPALLVVCGGIALLFAVRSHAARSLAWLAVLVIAMFEAGDRPLRWAGVRFDDPYTSAVVSLTTGMGVLALGGLVLGSLESLTFINVLIPVAALFALCAWRFLRWMRQDAFGFAGRVLNETSSLPVLELCLLGFIAAAVLVGYAMALAPEVQSDAVRIHLAMARIYARHGAMPALPYMMRTTSVVGGETLYTLAFVLHDETLAKLLNTSAGVLMIASAGFAARRLGGRRAGFIAAALIATTPLVMWELGTAYLDLFATAAIMAAVLTLLEWQETSAIKWAAMTGVLLGFGVAYKLGVLLELPGFALCFVSGLARTPSRRTRSLAAFGIGVMVVFGPWLVRSFYLKEGQLPELEVAGQQLGTRVSALGPLPSFGVGHNPLRMRTLPWALTFDTHAFGENSDGFIGFALLLCTPFVLFARWSRQMIAVAAIALTSMAAWFLVEQYIRYLLPVLALASVLIGTGLAAFVERLRLARTGIAASHRLLLTSALLLFLAVSPLGYLWTIVRFPGEIPVKLVLGREWSGKYIPRKVRQAPVLKRLGQLAAPDTPVIAIPEGMQLYSDAAMYGIFNGAEWLATPDTESAERTLENFERRGIHYMVVDHELAQDWGPVLVLSPRFLNQYAETIYAAGSVYLYRIHTTPLAPRAANELLVNGSFERVTGGAPDKWTRIGQPIVDESGAHAHEGHAAVQVSASAVFTQAVAVKPAHHYTLTHYSKCEQPGADVRLQVNWSTPAGVFVGASLEIRRGKPQYVQQRMWTEAPATAGWAVIYASTQPGARCWFDDFSFTEVP